MNRNPSHEPPSDISQRHYLPFKALFHKYCNSFKAKTGLLSNNFNGRPSHIYGFLDPTCSLFYDAQQCKEAADLDSNRSSFDLKDIIGRPSDQITEQMRTEWETYLTGRQTNVRSSVPGCLCTSTLHDVTHVNSSQLVGNESFVHTFESMNDGCPAQLIQNINCLTSLSGGNVILAGSEVNVNCGNTTSGGFSTNAPSSGTPPSSSSPSGSTGTGSTGSAGDTTYEIPPSSLTYPSYSRFIYAGIHRKIFTLVLLSILGFFVAKFVVGLLKNFIKSA